MRKFIVADYKKCSRKDFRQRNVISYRNLDLHEEMKSIRNGIFEVNVNFSSF